MQFAGDTGKFRKALKDAGFEVECESSMFNNSTTSGNRLLKLWFATKVVFAPSEQHQALFSQLRHEFGDRLLEVYSVPCREWPGGGLSLCVELKE